MARKNYYSNLAADYSRPASPDASITQKLIEQYEQQMARRQDAFPPLSGDGPLDQIEAENRQWWPARCAVIREGRFDLMDRENATSFAYLCQDGPFIGDDPHGGEVAASWGAILCQSGSTLVWPVVMFHGEAVFFEWHTIDDETGELIAAGNVTFLRRGHAGGCHLKTEHLSFYRDVSASAALMASGS